MSSEMRGSCFIAFVVLVSGCAEVLRNPGGVAQVVTMVGGSTPGSVAEQERQANAEANQAAELKRTRENAAIRETGKRLQREQPAQARESNESTAPLDETLPVGLTSSMISEAVTNVKTQMSCRPQSSSKGQVLVSVKVAADGQVASVAVMTTPDPTLGSCVRAAVERATFAKTQRGGSFRYPFVF